MPKGKEICSAFIIAGLVLFLFLLRYDIPLYGDDIGGLVANNPDSTYIDDRVVEGECTLDLDFSLNASWNRLRQSYFLWDGRVITKFITPLVRMIFSLPDRVSWPLFALYIMLFHVILLLVVVSAVCGSIREGLRAPMVVLLAGLLLFYIPSYSYAYMTWLIMYTFTNIYVTSVILYLLFCIAIRRLYMSLVDISIKTLVGITLLGFFAGLSHEAFGVIFGAVLLTQLVRFWLQNHRRISIRYLFMYIGYLVGFCICFFAPGNFNRAQQSHEAALRTVPLVGRIFNSIYIHAYVGYKIWIVPFAVLPILPVLFAVLLRKKVLTVKDVLTVVYNNLEWFMGFIMSAITWGLVARVVSYGMLAANALLIIGIIRTFRELWMLVTERIITDKRERWTERIQNVLAGLCVMAVIFLAVANYSDMSEVHQTAKKWREKIGVARKVGMEEIEVPAYPEELDYRFYKPNAINNQENYDKVAYRVVFDTRVVVE